MKPITRAGSCSVDGEADWEALLDGGALVLAVAQPCSVTSSAITGGDWALWAVGGAFSGEVVGGVILRDGDTTPNDVFPVVVVLQLSQGGTGTAYFVGELDHRPWVNHRKPPRIRGDIVQSPPAP